MVFAYATLTRPVFEAQIKTKLTSKLAPALLEALRRDVETCFKRPDETGIVADVLARSKALATLSAERAMGGKTLRASVAVPGLIEAEAHGKKERAKCSLMILEGLSAATLFMVMRGVLGNQHWAGLPVQGKFENVHGASLNALVTEIPEVRSICRALGLSNGTKPGDPALRYGRVVIATDQDGHGAHISGLFLMLMQKFWPELLASGFVWKFCTPVVKAFKGKKELAAFFDMPSFEAWALDKQGYEVVYYKGLGAYSPGEIADCCERLAEHLKQVTIDEAGVAALDLAFDAKRADDRKLWMAQPAGHLNYTRPTIAVKDFVDSELRAFANEQAHDLLPSLSDGLKVVQRKALHVARKNPTKKSKVTEFAGSLATEALYLRGDASDAVMNMAAVYTTGNNVGLFEVQGASGSRMGQIVKAGTKKKRAAVGRDAAAPRYVTVWMHPVVKLLFRKEDDVMLAPTVVEGKAAEPLTYSPVLPLGLVNGVRAGIATGYSSSFPGRGVLEVLAAVRARCVAPALALTPRAGSPARPSSCCRPRTTATRARSRSPRRRRRAGGRAAAPLRTPRAASRSPSCRWARAPLPTRRTCAR